MTVEASGYVPPTVAQQIFVIGSGIAGGLAGFHLAQKWAKVESVPTGPLVIATLVSIFFTLGSAVLLTKDLGAA